MMDFQDLDDGDQEFDLEKSCHELENSIQYVKENDIDVKKEKLDKVVVGTTILGAAIITPTLLFAGPFIGIGVGIGCLGLGIASVLGFKRHQM